LIREPSRATTWAGGAGAGMIAAGAWAAAEPWLSRVGGAGFTDIELLRGLTEALAPGRSKVGRPVGVALHLVNGAAFGAVFATLGGRGIVRGVLGAELEYALLWPLMAWADRAHPARRAGRWPPLLRSRRIFAQEVAAHALFGAVLGALTERSPARRRLAPAG